MFWILISLLLVWLIFREFRSTITAPLDMPVSRNVSKPYVSILLALALLSLWQPIHTWLFQRRLSAISTELADSHVAHVHCNTVIDTLFDQNSTNIGHASPKTGDIAFQYPWCNTLMAYLRHPERADREELASLGMFTHESMHVRGEYNEAGQNARPSNETSVQQSCLAYPTRQPRETRWATTIPSTCSERTRRAIPTGTSRTNARPGRRWTSASAIQHGRRGSVAGRRGASNLYHVAGRQFPLIVVRPGRSSESPPDRGVAGLVAKNVGTLLAVRVHDKRV